MPSTKAPKHIPTLRPPGAAVERMSFREWLLREIEILQSATDSMESACLEDTAAFERFASEKRLLHRVLGRYDKAYPNA